MTSAEKQKLKLVTPDFDSDLTSIIIDLNHLRKTQLAGSTPPQLFFQIKEVFHLLESVGSARIEGNRTTISEYIEQKMEDNKEKSDSFSEIANVENALSYIEDCISEGTNITHKFIRELHHLAVSNLEREGDKTPGAYRTWSVQISQSAHTPPEHNEVNYLMDELLNFINEPAQGKYQLLKTAIAHHRFTWIHPFGNGNGRVVRLLTYALLIKYGFNVKEGKIINPTAVFCNNRDEYYHMLTVADTGTDKGMLKWCEYVLEGILEEVAKVNQLTDHDFIVTEILHPSLEHSLKRAMINKSEYSILKMATEKGQFKSQDVKKLLPNQSPRQVTSIIKNLKENNLIDSFETGGRVYYANFINNYLMRGLMRTLEKKNFIPSID